MSEGPPRDAAGDPVHCGVCNTPVTVRSLTAEGARGSCECGRTTWVRLAGGELRLSQAGSDPSIPADPLTGADYPDEPESAMAEYPATFSWGNNPRRAELKGRCCRVVAGGSRMRSVLVEFTNGERVVTSLRALRYGHSPQLSIEDVARKMRTGA